MTDQYSTTGTGWPDAADVGAVDTDAGQADRGADRSGTGASVESAPLPDGLTDYTPARTEKTRSRGRRVSVTEIMIGVLLALFSFVLVVQLKNNSTDATLASARQEDLVRILSDLQQREDRVREEIANLESSQRQLTSGAAGRQAALKEASKRADELGILAGTLPARGPGLRVRFERLSKPITGEEILDVVEELRGAGAEAMQIGGGNGATVRIIASTPFVDAQNGGILVSGHHLIGPYTIAVIGDPQTMRTALNIFGGAVDAITTDGGTVTMQEPGQVDVTALSDPTDLQYASPVS